LNERRKRVKLEVNEVVDFRLECTVQKDQKRKIFMEIFSKISNNHGYGCKMKGFMIEK
jgi:hypothetical protein